MQNGMLSWPIVEQENSYITIKQSCLYVVPMWARILRVRACGGAGGGGGGDGGNEGGGGGGSGFVVDAILEVVPGEQIPITIGDGGAGGTGASSGNNGSNGEDTLFGDYLTAPGGKSGIGAGDVTGISGFGSGNGTNPGNPNTVDTNFGQDGGASPLTGSIAAGSALTSVSGASGQDGGGGGGGFTLPTSTGTAGGAGGDGWIQVEVLN